MERTDVIWYLAVDMMFTHDVNHILKKMDELYMIMIITFFTTGINYINVSDTT